MGQTRTSGNAGQEKSEGMWFEHLAVMVTSRTHAVASTHHWTPCRARPGGGTQTTLTIRHCVPRPTCLNLIQRQGLQRNAQTGAVCSAGASFKCAACRLYHTHARTGTHTVAHESETALHDDQMRGGEQESCRQNLGTGTHLHIRGKFLRTRWLPCRLRTAQGEPPSLFCCLYVNKGRRKSTS